MLFFHNKNENRAKKNFFPSIFSIMRLHKGFCRRVTNQLQVAHHLFYEQTFHFYEEFFYGISHLPFCLPFYFIRQITMSIHFKHEGCKWKGKKLRIEERSFLLKVPTIFIISRTSQGFFFDEISRFWNGGQRCTDV